MESEKDLLRPPSPDMVGEGEVGVGCAGYWEMERRVQ